MGNFEAFLRRTRTFLVKNYNLESRINKILNQNKPIPALRHKNEKIFLSFTLDSSKTEGNIKH